MQQLGQQTTTAHTPYTHLERHEQHVVIAQVLQQLQDVAAGGDALVGAVGLAQDLCVCGGDLQDMLRGGVTVRCISWLAEAFVFTHRVVVAAGRAAQQRREQ